MRDLDTFLAALDAKLADMRAMIAEAREPTAPAKSEPGGYWSPWLEWRGGPHPLPPAVQWEFQSANEPHGSWRGHSQNFPACIKGRFRYRATDDLGWLPRGDWTPPAELWDETCPVRLEWYADLGHDGVIRADRLEDWRPVHHVRLVARERKAGLPEGWSIDRGCLHSEYWLALGRDDYTTYGPDVIRQAVDAWLREMGNE